jgi:hypothetical protein
MTYYVTQPVEGLTGIISSNGYEKEIDEAIGIAMLSLRDEAGSDVRLISASVAAVPAMLGPKLYVTVVAEKLYPPIVALNGMSFQEIIIEMLKRMNERR